MTPGDLRDRLTRLLGLADWEGEGPPVDATFLKPDGPGPFPAVLYCHAHGGLYGLGRRELTEGARWLSAPFAPDLLAAGFAVLCLDMPGFGERQGEGSESALAKAGLWHGRPLFGRMLAELMAGLDWLRARPEVRADRIVTMGVSMGAAHAMWLAALREDVAACVQMCMLADMGQLIAAGVHDRHGHYLTVPGLLGVAEIGDVAGLIAPRPQFAGLGEADGLTPPPARDAALARVRAAYGGSTALEVFMSPAGHVEPPPMRAAVLGFLDRVAV